MAAPSSRKVVVFGDLAGCRAQRVWETVQYLLGFEKLGFQSFFAQSESGAPDGADVVERIMQRFGFGGRSGSGTGRLAEIARSADLLLVLPRARASMELREIDGPWVNLDEHGKSPVVLDCWRPLEGVPATAFAVHLSSRENADLLAKVRVPLQVVLGSDLLESGNGFMSHNWRVRAETEFSADPDRLRYFIMHSRGEIHFPRQPTAIHPGEITVPSVWYLASGRPVVMLAEEAANTGWGLICATDADEAADALQSVDSNYARHSAAAMEIARAHFSHDVVLRPILEAVNATPPVSRAFSKPRQRIIAKSPESPKTRFNLRVDGRQGFALVASCLGDGDTGGGVYAFDGQDVQCIDRVSSTGMCVFGEEGSEKLARLVWSPHYLHPAGELLLYDARGVRNYYRLENVSQVHDILWDGSNFIVASTGTNSLVWFDLSGKIVKKWSPDGADQRDCWHLNCLSIANGRLYASAFGRFSKRDGWRDARDQSVGMVFDWESNRDLIPKLHSPHTPRFVDGKWLVCNSGTNELLTLDASGNSIQRRVQLTAFTRGLALTDDFLFVGCSAKRHTAEGRRFANIAVLDRKNHRLLGSIDLPCREVYELVIMPLALLEGVKTGFRTNPLRVAEQDQHALFQSIGVQPVRLWATGDPLSPRDCKVRIEADVPAKMAAGAEVPVPCTVQNLGSALMVTAKPNPVHVSYKWFEVGAADGLTLEGRRTALPATLVPQASIGVVLSVETPPAEGKYILRITCVQEEVAWFDDLDPENIFEAPVSIENAPRPSDSPAVLTAQGSSNG